MQILLGEIDDRFVCGVGFGKFLQHGLDYKLLILKFLCVSDLGEEFLVQWECCIINFILGRLQISLCSLEDFLLCQIRLEGVTKFSPELFFPDAEVAGLIGVLDLLPEFFFAFSGGDGFGIDADGGDVDQAFEVGFQLPDALLGGLLPT